MLCSLFQVSMQRKPIIKSYKKQQKYSDKPLKIATIFSYAANESQAAIGEIDDESFSPTDIADISSKEFFS